MWCHDAAQSQNTLATFSASTKFATFGTFGTWRHTRFWRHPPLQGPILAFLYAVKELREELRGTLPVNVAFVFEVHRDGSTVLLRVPCLQTCDADVEMCHGDGYYRCVMELADKDV